MRVLFTFICMSFLLPCMAKGGLAIEDSLGMYIESKDARIGVAVMTADSCMFGVNTHDAFPMLSVMKFPLALAVAETVGERECSFDDLITVRKGQLHTDTYSPMLSKYSFGEEHRISVNELLDYALRNSDNNACDILIDFTGGISAVSKYLDRAGIKDVVIKCNEDDMQKSISRCYENTATPYAIVSMTDRFFKYGNDENSVRIKRMLETCQTGKDRLAAPLRSTDAVIGHKTGTGPVDKNTGRIVAVNDVGYICLPSGMSYSIAVFVADAKYSMEEAEDIIADISGMVMREMNRRSTLLKSAKAETVSCCTCGRSKVQLSLP